MAAKKFSIVIPYKQRLDNIKLVFASLADQTLDSSQFEVVVGAMEYDPEFVAACRQFTGRLDIISVLTAEDWSIPRARNLGIRNATGEVILFVDADVMLPPGYLRNLWFRHYQHGQRACVVGQMIGYDDAIESTAEKALPYSHYQKVLAELETTDRARIDDRYSPELASAVARFPWVYTRTGLVALPAATLREHDLYFDQGFIGWGPEDQEWGHRISRTGTPILFGQGPSLFGMHLPHFRDVAVNSEQAWRNNRYYLAKWPRLDLELALAFGWLETDRIYEDVERELADAAALAGGELRVVRGTVDGTDILLIGTALGSPELIATFGARTDLEAFPLAGFGLPYPDTSIAEAHVQAPILQLSERYREAIFREAGRVATKVVAPAGDDRR